MGAAVYECGTIHLPRYFIKIFYHKEKSERKIVGAIGTDERNGKIDPAQGMKEFIKRRHKTDRRERKYDYDHKENNRFPSE